MNARILGAAAAAAAFLTVAAPAGASTATYDDAGALHYTAAPGEKNLLSIQSIGDGTNRIVLSDNTGVVARGPVGRCSNDWYDSAVNCDMPTALYVDLGDGDDRATVSWDFANSLPVHVAGGAGADWIEADYTGKIAAQFDGGDGDDKLSGGPADDVLHGGAGTDDLSGSAGADQLFGDDGDDLLSGDGYKDPSPDVLDGGAGNDTVQTEWSASGTTSENPGPRATVTMAGGADDGRPGENDDVRNVEHLDLYSSGSFTGTDQADRIVLNNQSQANTVIGLGGDDELTTSEGADTIDGGTGSDRIDAGFGDDHIVGGPGQDRIFADHPGGVCGPLWCRYPFGNDVVEARDGEVDQIDCGAGQDRVVADAADVVGTDCETVERGAAVGPKPDPKPGQNGGPGPDPKPGSSPRLRVSVPAVTLARALRGKLTVTVVAPAAGKVKVQVLRGKALVATASGKARKAGKVTLKVKPSAAGKRALKKRGTVKLTLRATFTPRRGAPVQGSGVVTLKR